MSKIPTNFLDAARGGREFTVRYRWGELYEGDIEWTNWDKGCLIFEEKANDKDEPGVHIMDEGGWGYAGREKELEKAHGHVIFGRFAEFEGGFNQHLIQVEFLD